MDMISMDIHGYQRISMDIYRYQWMSMDIHGNPRISRIIHGYPWIIHEYPRITYGRPESFSSPNGTPLKLIGFQPDQSRWYFVRVFTNFVFSRVSFSYFLEVVWFSICFCRSHGPLRISLETAGATRDHSRRYSVFKWFFKKFPKSRNSTFQVFPWQFSLKLCGIDAQSMPSHFQH